MKNDKEKFVDASRSQQRAKRRKTNLILNSMILIVLALIVIVSVNIFGKDDKTEAGSNTEVKEVSAVEGSQSEGEKLLDDQEKNDDKALHDDHTEDQHAADEDFDQSEEEAETDEEETVNELEEIDDERIASGEDEETMIKDPNWKPVGTTQIEPAQDYSIGSVDWNEQLRAVSYATGFDQGKGDILYRLENNGPKKSKATVHLKESNKRYQVFLEWVDEGGWQPALVEEVTS